MTKRLTLIGILLFAWRPVTAQPSPVANPVVVPAGGTAITAQTWANDMVSAQRDVKEFGGATLSEAGVVLTTAKLPKTEYTLETRALITRAVEPGQIVLIRFKARSLKAATMTGQTQLAIYFQKSSPDWKKSFYSYVDLSDQWQQFSIPFKLGEAYQPGEAAMYFAYGFESQTAEISQLEVLAYPVGTDIKSMPRSQRPQGEISEAAYSAAVERIIHYRKLLLDKPAPKGTPTRVLHVAADARTGGDGTPDKPFLTLQAAVNVAEPGDTILVGPGTYDKDGQGATEITRSGKPDAWIVIKPSPGAGRPKIVSREWNTILVRSAHYIEIRGLELVGVPDERSKNSGNGIGIRYKSSNVRVIDNVIHGFGGGGIYGYTADHVHFEGNVVHTTSFGSEWGNSGISLYQCYDSDEAPGYHNVIRRNIVYRNENKIPFKHGGGKITDGNGIIIDDNRHTQKYSPTEAYDEAYRGWTLIENNLVFHNGGRGTHSFLSDRIDAINNTTYLNQFTPDIRGGEITAAASGEIYYFNNIVYGIPTKRGNSADGARGEVLFASNLLYNSEDFLVGRDAILGKDPLFQNARADSTDASDFRLRSNSPAIDAAVPAVAPRDDLFGQPRDGRPDLGAIERR